MRLNRHDPRTEIELNMTPMIDVVFLLIIFFMLITDLTQQDLEQLELPAAASAVPDQPDPEVVRPVINILDTGEMIVKRERKYDPEQDDLREIEVYLSNQAHLMPTRPLNADGSGPRVPDHPLLIRADRNAEFKYVQRVMELCSKKGIQIWKLELAAAEVQDEREAAPAPGE